MKFVDQDGEIAWFIPLIAAVVGGTTNLIANWNNVNGFWQGLTTFGVGAGTGLATALTAGAGASALGVAGVAAASSTLTGANNSIVAQTGTNFSGFNNIDWGQVGINSAASGVAGFAGGMAGSYGSQYLGGAILNGTNITSPLAQGAITGGVSGMAGGYVGGFSAGLVLTGDFKQANAMGKNGLFSGLAMGSASGMVSSYIYARQHGIDPLTGKTLLPRRVGYVLESIEDIMANPKLVEGKAFEQIESLVGKTDGWKVGSMDHSTRAEGWMLRELNMQRNNTTGRLLQYHPGTPRHFDGRLYWKVSNGILGTTRYRAF